MRAQLEVSLTEIRTNFSALAADVGDTPQLSARLSTTANVVADFRDNSTITIEVVVPDDIDSARGEKFIQSFREVGFTVTEAIWKRGGFKPEREIVRLNVCCIVEEKRDLMKQIISSLGDFNIEEGKTHVDEKQQVVMFLDFKS